MPRPLSLPGLAGLACLAALFGLSGCSNSCARICTPMADYARECGLTVTAADIQQCEDANGGEVTDAQVAVCSEYADPQKLREWWTCDDVAANMSGAE